MQNAANRIKKKFAYLPIDKLVPSKLNNYEVNDELKESIRTFDIITPLSVVGPKEDGTYEIIVGERRYRGAKCLYDEGDGYFKEIPCFIFPEKTLLHNPDSPDETEVFEMDDLDKALQIEMSNLESRDDFDRHAHRMHVISIIQEKMRQSDTGLTSGKLKKEMNAMICKYLKISPRYRRYYVSVMDEGTPMLNDMVSKGELPLKEASWIAGQEEDVQQEILGRITSGNPVKEVLRDFKENLALGKGQDSWMPGDMDGEDNPCEETGTPESQKEADTANQDNSQLFNGIRDMYAQAFDVSGNDETEERIIKGDFDDRYPEEVSQHIGNGILDISGGLDDMFGQFCDLTGNVNAAVDTAHQLKTMQSDVLEEERSKKSSMIATVRKWMEKVISEEKYSKEEEELIQLCKEIAQLF